MQGPTPFANGLFAPFISLKPSTFANLRAQGIGTIDVITDGSTGQAGAVVAGSGSNKVVVWYDGINWRVLGPANDAAVAVIPSTFASLPANPAAGTIAAISDSNTVTWGATAAGGGANYALLNYNGTNWTVIGK